MEHRLTRRLVIGTAVAIAAGAVILLRPAARPAPSPSPGASSSARLPKLLELGSTSCIPCKAMVPVLDGLRTDYAGRLEVEVIDVWKNPDAAEVWRVVLMPTQVYVASDGKELARHEGFSSRTDIVAQWKRLGVSLD